jgi:hypothetical protein
MIFNFINKYLIIINYPPIYNYFLTFIIFIITKIILIIIINIKFLALYLIININLMI